MYPVNTSFVEGLEITLIAMTIVFVLLYAVSVALEFFGKLEEKRVKSLEVTPKVAETEKKAYKADKRETFEKNKNAQLAILVASIHAKDDFNHKDFKVVNIEKVG